MPHTSPKLAPVSSGDKDFDKRIKIFFEGLAAISDRYMDANFPSLNKPKFHLDELRVRWRIRRDGGVHCFVDKKTGDVLKPASFSAPAKHARGNIFDAQNGLGSMGAYGPAYLR